VTVTHIKDWLEKLGYAEQSASLHRTASDIPDTHPYGPEINALLRPDGAIRARAVFEVEGVPSVVFLGDDDNPIPDIELDRIRQKIWNQNLVNVVLEIRGESAHILPARKLTDGAQTLELSKARADGEFSAREISSASIVRRLPDWFDVKARVDSKLLENLSVAVREIELHGYPTAGNTDDPRRLAELLMGQVLFISYLEHRQIVGTTYRKHHDLNQFHDLVSNQNRSGMRKLIDCLRQDFNGDFLADDRHDPWAALTDAGFRTLDLFLSRTDLKTGQGDFWNYDFSFIPVELLSGLYESFLSPEEQARSGAYYTPRHLAMLAIDQAFSASSDPLSETIFDGACGSGILLTTAYRRLIALREASDEGRLSFKARRDLLVSQIFGADINPMACRVTAFSLYLSLLEGLDPSDIIEAQAQENVKLPTLAGTNLLSGEEADFFAVNHGFADRKFSLLISNPPWGQAAGESVTSADHWAKKQGATVALRQIAGAFSLRSLDFLHQEGRLCLILPITLFVGPTNARFVSHLLRSVQPARLINFGDLQNLLFPSAEHTCHVFVGQKRAGGAACIIPLGETFDYCVPKSDLSLALGRLTLQTADRHQLQTRTVIQSPQTLVTLMWGDNADLALITRLELFGKLGDFWTRTDGKSRWSARKGLHIRDKSRIPVSSEPLRDMGFVKIESLSAGVPVLHSSLLVNWPDDQPQVALLDEKMLEHFDGPRVLFADGFSREDLALRAVYYDQPASFTKSIGVIAGSEADSGLLKFVAVYLRSSLGRYFLMMRAWKMLCERNAVHLSDVATFPFFEPEAGTDPERSTRALENVSLKVAQLTAIEEWQQNAEYLNMKEELDEHVFDYFDLSVEERALVRETVNVFMPSIRPRGYRSLNTPAQQSASKADVEIYAQTLSNELTNWRKRTNGQGRFHVHVVNSEQSRAGPVGIARIEFDDQKTTEGSSSVIVNNDAVIALLSELGAQGLSIMPSTESLWFVPDTFIWSDGAVIVARTLTRRNWTIRQALRDAEHIVRSVQERQTSKNKPVAV
jgi:hypothetical protein|tara:strand:- start:3602 stop:6706 length:3105 start_codon:yes stop_codon:yes gene_type:complete